MLGITYVHIIMEKKVSNNVICIISPYIIINMSEITRPGIGIMITYMLRFSEPSISKGADDGPHCMDGVATGRLSPFFLLAKLGLMIDINGLSNDSETAT